MEWETVIGLEIHTQLATKSKIFSGASIAYGAEPNTQACAVDLGLPGVLPVLNKEAVNRATKLVNWNYPLLNTAAWKSNWKMAVVRWLA